MDAKSVGNAHLLEELLWIAGAHDAVPGTEDRHDAIVRPHRHGVGMNAGAEAGLAGDGVLRNKDRGDAVSRVAGLVGGTDRDDVKAAAGTARRFRPQVRAERPSDLPVGRIVALLLILSAYRLVAGDGNNLT